MKSRIKHGIFEIMLEIVYHKLQNIINISVNCILFFQNYNKIYKFNLLFLSYII